MDDVDELYSKVKVFNERIWEGRADRPVVDRWLSNFRRDTNGGDGPSERLHALYLLSQFMYFGAREIRELLRAVYRDLYRYPIIEAIRRNNNDTLDSTFIDWRFKEELRATRFLGVGNPSESGTHLLYYFRQENGLSREQFIHSHEVFERYGSPSQVRLRDPDIRRYVFLDDFCGAGTQAIKYSESVVRDVKTIDQRIEVDYYMLFATRHGRDKAKDSTLFDRVECVLELDDTFKCFGDACRYFLEGNGIINKDFALTLCRQYGERLFQAHPLGYDDCQLLIAFHHNTPDNTLPIFWYADDPTWEPIFRRYPKVYGWGEK